MEAIIVAIITGGISLLGTVLTIASTSRKQTEAVRDELKSQHEEFKVEQAVMTEQIASLKNEVKTHNDFARRMPVVEEQIKVINHRLSDIEKGDDRK